MKILCNWDTSWDLPSKTETYTKNKAQSIITNHLWNWEIIFWYSLYNSLKSTLSSNSGHFSKKKLEQFHNAICSIHMFSLNWNIWISMNKWTKLLFIPSLECFFFLNITAVLSSNLEIIHDHMIFIKSIKNK